MLLFRSNVVGCELYFIVFPESAMASRKSSTDVDSASNKKRTGGLKPKLGWSRSRVLTLAAAAKQARVLMARFTQPDPGILGW